MKSHSRILSERIRQLSIIIIVVTTVVWLLLQTVLLFTPEVTFVAVPAFDPVSGLCRCGNNLTDYCKWYHFLQDPHPDFTVEPPLSC